MMRVLIACLFIGGVLAVPVKRNVDEFCETGATRFKPNTRYTYRYVATSVTGVNGTTNQTTGLRLEAKCEIEGVEECQNLLRVTNVRLFEATPNKKFKPSPNEESFKAAIEADHLYFTENNGGFIKISPVKTEPVYITNIKRGILSALQLQFTEEPLIVLPEVDVSGNCSSEYKIVKAKESETEVIKTRNLSNCTKRSHNVTKLNPVMYGVNSTVQGLFNSTSRCRYKVESHVKTVQCNETHLLRPFSYNGAGVTTNVTLNLTLESTQRLRLPDYELRETRKTNLLYEHIAPENSEPVYESNSQNAKAILEELITVLPINETKPITAVQFTSLVFSIRKLDVKAQRDIWTRFYNCDEGGSEFTEKQCKKSQAYLLDAFTQCGSTPCMRFIIEAIRDYDQVKSEHVAYLLTGMSSVQDPSPYLFSEVIDLLQQKENLPKTTLLSLGTMIRKYCQLAPEECLSESDSEVMDAVDYLEEQRPKHCDATPSTVDDVIITLKAIGNAGRMRSNGTELVKCSQGANYLNISVVAIETIRRFSYCPDTWKSLKREVFGDFRIDPELRLQAYLALMKYPSEQIVRYVAEVLDDEINTQVGAFVSTHLKQMNDSVEPTHGKML